MTEIKQVDTQFLEDVLSGEAVPEHKSMEYNATKHKFVLAEGENGDGYLTFGTPTMGLGEIYDFMKRYNNFEIKNKGGGWLEKACQESRQGVIIPERVLFYGSSDDLGNFDRELLNRTLQGNLRQDFPYEIYGYCLRLK